jgi:hypothetical protein
MPTSEEDGRRLIAAGYSDQFARMANDCSTWLFWYRPVSGSQHKIINKGSVFFVDAGAGPFGVTASHVIQGLLCAKRSYQDVGVQMGNISLDPSLLLLGDDPVRDVATFRINERDIASVGKRPHVDPKQWPPPRPQENRGVFFGGYRGPDNNLITPDEPVPWDFWHGFGPITGVFDGQLTARFERADWVSRPGQLTPPPGAEWGGTSGGPMFALFEAPIVYFRLSGVIKEYSSAVELMAFAPIDRIGRDGALTS